MPPGFTAVTPYLTVDDPDELLDFAKAAFDAEEVKDQRALGPDGRLMHAAFRVEGCIIETGRASSSWKALPAGIHLYVRDADAAYGRALKAGARACTRCGTWNTGNGPGPSGTVAEITGTSLRTQGCRR